MHRNRYRGAPQLLLRNGAPCTIVNFALVHPFPKPLPEVDTGIRSPHDRV